MDPPPSSSSSAQTPTPKVRILTDALAFAVEFPLSPRDLTEVEIPMSPTSKPTIRTSKSSPIDSMESETVMTPVFDGTVQLEIPDVDQKDKMSRNNSNQGLLDATPSKTTKQQKQKNGGCLDKTIRCIFFLEKLEKQRYRNESALPNYRPYFLYVMSAIQFFVMMGLIIADGGFAALKYNPMIGPTSKILVKAGGNVARQTRDDFFNNSYRLVTAMFLHGGLVHLALNLFNQILIGKHLERFWGPWRMCVIYFLSSLGGNLATTAFRTSSMVTVGGSGGLLGIVGALNADLLKNWKLLWAPKAQLIYWTIISASFIFSGLVPMIDNIVHVGGFLTGFFLGFCFIPFLAKPVSLRRANFFLWTGIIFLITYFTIMIVVIRNGEPCGEICCKAFLSNTC